MIVEIAHFALILAFVISCAQAFFPALSMRAARAQFVLCLLAYAGLTFAYVTSDFSVLNVAQNSHTAKPLLYKVTGVWANHEGSMLLWVLLLSFYSALLPPLPPGDGRGEGPQRIMGFLSAGFLGFILFASNPFLRLFPAPENGADLNPLLQDPGLAFHPPLLYLGYVGFAVPFALAASALWQGRIDPQDWARQAKRWILFAWTTLSAGIALGSWWAYYELGWGGWWFWDPVENASLMPWLIGTALLHSVIVMEKRGALARWTLLLALLAFSFSMLGTFLVRSGVLTSVHAFALDPARGIFILALITLYTGGALLLYGLRVGRLPSTALFSPVSREGALVLNNLFLTVIAATVFTGTLYPLLMEAVGGDQISVGPPYFHATVLPLTVPLVLLMAVGPFLAWKTADLRGIAQRLQTAFLLTLCAVLVTVMAQTPAPGFSLLGIGLAAWLMTATFASWKENAGGSRPQWARIRHMKAQHWSLALAHFGLGLAMLGMIGTGLWTKENLAVLDKGEKMQLGAYTLTLDAVTENPGPNYTGVRAIIAASKGTGRFTLAPEIRHYPVAGSNTTEAAIRTSWHDDIYVALGGPDTQSEGWIVHAWVHPLVPFLWAGFALIVLGGAVGLLEKRHE